MGNDSVLHAGISCSLTHKPYFAKLSKDPSHLGDDGDDDGESLAGGDVSGLSELGSSISSAATASSLSRSDSLLSRLACQLQDIQLFNQDKYWDDELKMTISWRNLGRRPNKSTWPLAV